MSADAEFEARFARVEGLLAELSRANDARLEQAAREVLSTVLELHQRGLERVLEIAAKEERVRDELSRDNRISAMLLLHGLHPTAQSDRIARTVHVLSERFRSKIESATVEVREQAGIVVRIVPVASACTSTRASLKTDWEQALLAAAPDADALSVELAEPTPALVTLRLRRDSLPVIGQNSGVSR